MLLKPMIQFFVIVFFPPTLRIADIILGLRDVHIRVPLYIRNGDDALLMCNYNLENDTLYSIKWYRGRREFYRYLPKENPAIKLFPVSGITVEVSGFFECYFMLSPVQCHLRPAYHNNHSPITLWYSMPSCFDYFDFLMYQRAIPQLELYNRPHPSHPQK